MKNRRELPWRADRDAYHVLVSEMMLQQTRIETVIPYYERFIRELPDFYALSHCDEEKLLKLWEGLGYYSRVRNLQKTAKTVCESYNGVFPDSYKEAIALSGVGEYTAAAVLSIAYRRPIPVCDGNVLRVYSRILESYSNVLDAQTKKNCTADLNEMYQRFVETSGEAFDAGMFNQALMELGETVCLPGEKPKCDICPIQSECRAYRNGTAGKLPVREKQLQKQTELKTVFILKMNGKTGIVKNTASGLLSGMFALHSVPSYLSEEDMRKHLEELGFTIRTMKVIPEKKHAFTHKIWKMIACEAEVSGERDTFTTENPGESDIFFVSEDELLTRYALPSAYRKWDEILYD